MLTNTNNAEVTIAVRIDLMKESLWTTFRPIDINATLHNTCNVQGAGVRPLSAKGEGQCLRETGCQDPRRNSIRYVKKELVVPIHVGWYVQPRLQVRFFSFESLEGAMRARDALHEIAKGPDHEIPVRGLHRYGHGVSPLRSHPSHRLFFRKIHEFVVDGGAVYYTIRRRRS